MEVPKVAPSQERELKSRHPPPASACQGVAPSQERELKYEEG